jgi:hypothetical protein
MHGEVPHSGGTEEKTTVLNNRNTRGMVPKHQPNLSWNHIYNLLQHKQVLFLTLKICSNEKELTDSIEQNSS